MVSATVNMPKKLVHILNTNFILGFILFFLTFISPLPAFLETYL